MHLLTKIFVVLVALLAVLLVPLVVVYSHNEDSFKKRFQEETARAAALAQKLNEEQVTFGARQSELEVALVQRTAENEQIARARDEALADVRELQRGVAQAESQQARISADLATLASAMASSQQIMEKLLTEVQTVRAHALDSERRVVDLDERLRDLTGQLEVAEAARRAMAEEVQQLKEELAQARGRVDLYAAKFGPIETEGQPTVELVDRDLAATVVEVRRGDQILAEINAGARDGMKKGWVLPISRDMKFIANLRIIEVDINRSTGVVELEDQQERGAVQRGDRVLAFAGKS